MYNDPISAAPTVPPSTSTAPAVVRTVVPLAVGGIVSGAVALGIDLGPGAEAVLAPAIGLLVGGAYYWAVRLIAKRWPWTERLLGNAKVPAYHAAAPRTLMDPGTGEVYRAYVITSLPGQSGPRGLDF